MSSSAENRRVGRRFIVYRSKDVSGVSGTGLVAEGIRFHDGQVVVSWFGKHHIFECPASLKTWLRVHGHGGKTQITWLDKKSQTSISSFNLPKNGSKPKAKR